MMSILTTPFLTDIDPQAAVKGSRDPLGLQTIWARLGRHVVGNLTTVSTSVRDFTTLVLGYYFAERVANEGSGDGDLAVFLRWEQLAAYARGEINGDWNFRGVERVKKNLQEGGRIRLGTDSTAQILSNQKTYGLWGLYSVPARSSGLVEGDPTRLTAVGRNIVETLYLPVFAKGGLRNADAVVARLAKRKTDLDWQKADRPLLKIIAAVLNKHLAASEREEYRRHLLFGGPQDRTAGGQAILAEAMDSTFDDESWTLSPTHIRHLAKRCAADGDAGASVAKRLERIRTAELLLAPAASLFGLVLASDGQTINELSRVVTRQWGTSVRSIDVDATTSLEPELRDSTEEVETGQRWIQIARTLASGDFAHTLALLLAQNSFVMKMRGGAAPWVDITEGRLRVRFRDDDGGYLPKRSELPELWRHSYFLDSLRAVALALRA
jgi:hypothetical protein